MGLSHPVDLCRRDVQCFVPGQLDEIAGSAPGAFPCFQPSAANGRAGDARPVVDGGGQDVGNAGWVGVMRKRSRGDDAVPLDTLRERLRQRAAAQQADPPSKAP